MKKVEDLTLKEYDEYLEEMALLNTKDFNIFRILELFGIKNGEDLEVGELNRLTRDVVAAKIEVPILRKEYTIKGKSLHPVLIIRDIKAAQFVDFQAYMSDFKLYKVLSVFLLPIKYSKSRIFKRKVRNVMKYNDGYDVVELQDLIYNNFKIGDAMALSGFFFKLSVNLLPLIQNSLMMDQMVQIERLRRKVKTKSE